MFYLTMPIIGKNADGSLIMRWDNAPHYPAIATHPHHKHVGNESNVQPSYEHNLFEVLSFIRNELLSMQ